MQLDSKTGVTGFLRVLLRRPRSCVVVMIFWLAILVLVVPAAAALAPHEQRAAELKAVISDSGIIGRFGANRPIEKVEWIKPDQYRVSGGRCHLDVTIKDAQEPAPMAGGRRFVLVLSALVCE